MPYVTIVLNASPWAPRRKRATPKSGIPPKSLSMSIPLLGLDPSVPNSTSFKASGLGMSTPLTSARRSRQSSIESISSPPPIMTKLVPAMA